MSGDIVEGQAIPGSRTCGGLSTEYELVDIQIIVWITLKFVLNSWRIDVGFPHRFSCGRISITHPILWINGFHIVITQELRDSRGRRRGFFSISVAIVKKDLDISVPANITAVGIVEIELTI